MNKLDAVIILAFVAIDDLRNALFAVLINSDATALVLLLAVVYFLNKNQDKLARSLSFGALTDPLKKLKLA